ncbi:glycoside hydrolase family 3 C-terminal domain-containing protein [Lysinibacter sp. HNR]|uniref:glycoside hydrolase family 3 protein n=1 Tax=Lysinibacter sp. HNR TaxID=3031408 RepID=UPI002434C992|nr:glycoside hydrolase family 3 C-terminal domain-containing protein [Lysinibacter sp. HNR]WGD36771.1 glycoside hydrolase family 3 C-terminal domain-containing protein [Lysinibacter sp. HNR]
MEHSSYEAELLDILKQLTLEEKVSLVSGATFWSTTEIERVGLRSLMLSDGPAGVRGPTWSEKHPSASLPNPTALAATFNPELAKRAGQLIGSEARRKNVDIVLGPTVNLHRSPLAGRNFEAFSEDPVLTAETAVALVQGIQSQGVAATAKHFIGNDAETDRFTANSVIDEHTLRTVYALPFEEMVTEAGVWAVMSSYNSINGTTGTESPLLRDMLRGEWGFDGLIISDWDAVRSVEGSGKTETTLAMPGPKTAWNKGLLQAVKDNRVPEADLDKKVIHLLRTAARVGALRGFTPAVDPNTLEVPPQPTDAEVRSFLTDLAIQGSVLLRNQDEALPIQPESVKRIAVIGPAAERVRSGGGGSATVVPPHLITPLEGIRTQFPQAEIRYTLGADTHELLKPIGSAGRAASGTPGVDVQFFASDGTLLGSEERDGNDVVYGMGYPNGIDGDRVHRIRLSTTLGAEHHGTRRISVAGVGRITLSLGNQVLSEEHLALGSVDPIGGLSFPPQRVHDVELAASPQVVTVDFIPDPDTLVNLRLGYAGPQRTAAQLLAEAEELAAWAEVALVFVGSTEADESEGFDRTTLSLGSATNALVETVATANPQTVVVLNVGSPVALPWRERVAAILLSHFPGQEGGTAIARVLSGEAEPGGRLPNSWPESDNTKIPLTSPINGEVVYSEGSSVGYRNANTRFSYGFGHGLGYSSWSRESVRVQWQHNGALTISVSVGNTGKRIGQQTVMAFASSPEQNDSPPFYIGSAQVTAGPGEATTATITVPPARISRVFGYSRGLTDLKELSISAGFASSDRSAPITITRPA